MSKISFDCDGVAEIEQMFISHQDLHCSVNLRVWGFPAGMLNWLLVTSVVSIVKRTVGGLSEFARSELDEAKLAWRRRSNEGRRSETEERERIGEERCLGEFVTIVRTSVGTTGRCTSETLCSISRLLHLLVVLSLRWNRNRLADTRGPSGFHRRSIFDRGQCRTLTTHWSFLRTSEKNN